MKTASTGIATVRAARATAQAALIASSTPTTQAAYASACAAETTAASALATASRSISHYRAWLWLLGDDELLAFARENYEPYGIPILKRICALRESG